MTTSHEPHPTPADLLRGLVAKRDEFLSFVERRIGDRSQAEDILQDAFAKGIEHLGQLHTPSAANAWFYRVLRNASIEVYRRRARHERAMTTAEAEVSTAAGDPSFDTIAAGCRCVGELVEGLKPEYAHALTRIEVEGVAVKDYAAEHGITPNNAAVRVHRARKALAREVESCCGGCATLGCADCTCES